MSGTILKTKLQPPIPRADLVSRKHLEERLNLARQRQIALVSAPAGYGKTTLVGQWTRSLDMPLAWISLDRGDNDPVTFLVYLIAALQQVDDGLGQTAAIALASPSPVLIQALLPSLINDIATTLSPFVLVLDDYHVIEQPAIHAAITFLIENQPAQLHLVIVTRADPPLNLTRLRANGRLTELRVADLRFVSEEVEAFLNDLMALKLAPEEARTLEVRTEGWPVGLQLSALSMQGRADKQAFIADFSGGHHYILEYLTEEVLSRQPEAVQSFLQRTAILKRLTGPLCDALTGGDDGRAVLEHLLRLNLFVIPLDDEHRWYRYHQLFADLLRNRLRQTLPAADISHLHRRAGAWHAEHGSLEEAINHSLKGEDYGQAAGLIEQAAGATMLNGRLVTLQNWLDTMPADQLDGHPRLRIYQGWAFFLNGRAEEAEAVLLASQAVLEKRPQSAETDALRGELATMLATIISIKGDGARTQEEALKALALLPETALVSRARATRALGIAHGLDGDTDESIKVWQKAGALALDSHNAFLAGDILNNIGSTHIHRGRLREAARSFEQLINLGTEQDAVPLPFTTLGYAGLAHLHIEWNQLDMAGRYLEKGVALGRQGGIGYHLIAVYTAESRLKQALGDSPRALDALQHAQDTLAFFPSIGDAIHLIWCQARLHAQLGDPATVAKWAGQGIKMLGFTAGLADLPLVIREVHQLTLARAALVQGDLRETRSHCAAVLTTAEAAGRFGRVIEAHLLDSLAAWHGDDTGRAFESLASSLALAEPEGYSRLYLEEGRLAADLLAAYGRQPAIPPRLGSYVQTLLQGYGAHEAPGQVLVEPLTKREMEVMTLIAQGYANRQIAAELFISLHTVKKHTSNIYGKLSVSNRTQAVARLRELNLL